MKAIETALKYVGDKELFGNVFTENTELGKKLKAAGHKDGEAWCALFTEAVFKEAYPEKFAEYDRLFSKSAVQTYKNFFKSGYLTGNVPLEGHLVIWQKYKDGLPTWQGHAGIVYKVKSSWEFQSIEGNTNEAGSREGNTVAVKDRKVLKEVKDGLKVLGFIQMI